MDLDMEIDDGDGHQSGDGAVGRLRPGRQPRACSACRARKLRCTESDTPGICRRCRRQGLECLLPRPRDRIGSRTNVLSRVNHLEKALQGIVASLSNDQDLPTSSTSPAHPPSAPRSHVDTHATTPTLSSGRPPSIAGSVPTTTSTPYDHPSTHPRSGSQSHPTSIPSPLQAPSHADVLLLRYAGMAHAYFPYILIPPGISAARLKTTRPMLYAAALATAAWDEPRGVQVRLERECLSQLGDRLLLRGEKSLDVLQGLLVYLAWYHFHIKPQAQQSYRLMVLAVGVLMDLGLHDRPRTRTVGLNKEPRDYSILTLVDSNLGLVDGGGDWSIDAKRTLLGCYIHSISTAIAFRKPNPMPWTPYIEECAKALARHQQQHSHRNSSSSNAMPLSDATLVHHVRLAHIAEETYTTFRYGTQPEYAASLDDERALACVKALTARMAAWKEGLPDGLLASDQNLQASYLVFHTFIHEIGCYTPTLPRMLPSTPQAPSITRLVIIFDCLSSMAQYMSHIRRLASPPASSPSTSIPDPHGLQTWPASTWRRVNYILLLGSDLALKIHATATATGTAGVASPGGDFAADRLRRLDAVVAWLSRRVEAVMHARRNRNGEDGANTEAVGGSGTSDDDEGGGAAWFATLLAQWARLRARYAAALGAAAIERTPSVESDGLMWDEDGFWGAVGGPGVPQQDHNEGMIRRRDLEMGGAQGQEHGLQQNGLGMSVRAPTHALTQMGPVEMDMTMPWFGLDSVEMWDAYGFLFGADGQGQG